MTEEELKEKIEEIKSEVEELKKENQKLKDELNEIIKNVSKDVLDKHRKAFEELAKGE